MAEQVFMGRSRRVGVTVVVDSCHLKVTFGGFIGWWWSNRLLGGS
jgi:hypothetical protein